MPATRDRLVTATAELFRRQGYRGTSLKQVVDAADATIGSLYHFFPGGKDELTGEVIVTTGAVYRQLFDTIADSTPDVTSAVGAFFEGAALTLEQTDFIDPCPIGGIAREVAGTNDALRRATHDVFASWVDAATGRFIEGGLDDQTSRELGITVVSAIEGGFVVARAARDAELLRAIGRQMTRLVAATLAGGRADQL